jgi:hypothetical protein
MIPLQRELRIEGVVQYEQMVLWWCFGEIGEIGKIGDTISNEMVMEL